MWGARCSAQVAASTSSSEARKSSNPRGQSRVTPNLQPVFWERNLGFSGVERPGRDTIVSVELGSAFEETSRALGGYCYRMLGAWADTEDAVQETMLRAFQHADSYDAARGPLRPWIFRIATNVCIDMLRSRGRRATAMDMGPAAEAGAPLGAPLPAERWIEPMPDSRLIAARDPEAVVLERQTVRLAFIAVLQHLPPRQRAALILCDVLRFPAGEAAKVLDTSTAGLTSALQRGRGTIADHRPAASDPLDEMDSAQRALLDRYVDAFERHDVEGLKAVMRADVQSSMPPFAWWVQGRERLARLMTSGGCEGARLLPTVLNGSPGFGQYRPDEDGVLRPFGLVVVELFDGAVSHVATFLGTADRFAACDLPATWPTPGAGLTDEFRAQRS